MQSPNGQLTLALLAGVLVCSLLSVGVVADPTPASERGATATAGVGDLSTEEFEADRTQFRIIVHENGSAEWIFRYEQRLETDESVEEFEAYAERFLDTETESYDSFRSRSVSLAEAGSEVTGREMSAGRFDRDAGIEERPPAGNEFGIIEMSFVWTGFAELDGDRLVVGDVFVDGLYVGPDQELRFERGPTLRFDSAEPTPDSMAAETLADSETVSWTGERQFTDRRPRVVYVDRASTSDQPSATESEPEDAESNPPVDAPDDDTSFVPLLALVLVLLLGAGSAIAYRSRGRLLTGSTVAESEQTQVSESETDAANVSRSGEDELSAVNDAPDSARSEPADTELTDEALLSDEERVIALLESRGGRMKQVDIVGNTEWSKSKVSMLLSEMEEEGSISKLRVGRENIVSLDGHEPDAVGSPFDEDG